MHEYKFFIYACIFSYFVRQPTLVRGTYYSKSRLPFKLHYFVVYSCPYFYLNPIGNLWTSRVFKADSSYFENEFNIYKSPWLPIGSSGTVRYMKKTIRISLRFAILCYVFAVIITAIVGPVCVIHLPQSAFTTSSHYFMIGAHSTDFGSSYRYT